MIRNVYRFRLYPTEEQKHMFAKHFGATRWLWNHGLQERIEHYEKEKKTLSFYDQSKDIPLLKKELDTAWLKEVNSQSLVSTYRHLDGAYKKFFQTQKRLKTQGKPIFVAKKGKSKLLGLPRFKSKFDSRQSFECPQNVVVDFQTSMVSLPKMPDIPARLHRHFEGKVKTCTISKTPSDKYYIAVLVELEGEYPERVPIVDDTTVGINLGVRYFGTLDNGLRIENPNHMNKSLKRLQRLNRQLARKEKDSNRRKRAKLALARLHERIANQRSNFLHNTSKELLEKYDTVITEDWNVKAMVERDEYKLNRRIHDAGWSTFNGMLAYKSERYGKNAVKTTRGEKTTKICSACFHVNEQVTISMKKWPCKKCHKVHDIDINASRNVKRLGMELVLKNKLKAEKKALEKSNQ